MPLTSVEEGSALTVWVTGEVDHHAARELMAALTRQVETALPRRLVLDLGGVTFMDSSGIALVLRTWKRMRELEGEMTLRSVPPQPEKILRTAQVDKLISFS